MSVLFYSTLVALVIVLISGPVLIPILHKMKFGQSIRQEGPKSHQAKTGTPVFAIAAAA